jgi:hypothetical protein
MAAVRPRRLAVLRTGKSLLQLRHAINDAEFHVIAELDLHHFGRKALPDVEHVLRGELELAAAPFDEMIQQQRGEILDLVVVGMLAEVENLRHRRLTARCEAYLSPNRPRENNAPKEGGRA